MKKQELDRIYTEKATELLTKGYTIHTGTMNGSQGEVAHLDFTNGSEVLRLLMERNCAYEAGLESTWRICIGRCTDDLSRGSGIWNYRLETVWEIEFAQLTEDWLVGMEEGIAAGRKRVERLMALCEKPQQVSDAFKSVALRWLRKQPKMKRCQLEDIQSVKRGTWVGGGVCYEIIACGRTFRLHA